MTQKDFTNSSDTYRT